MFTTPVKIVEVSGGGGDLPLMTWDQNDPYYTGIDPENYTFSNSYKTIQGNFIKARSNYPVVPDHWYLEIMIDPSPGQYGMYGFTTETAILDDVWIGVTSWIVSCNYAQGVYLENDYPPPLVYAAAESGNRLLSVDGINTLESLSAGDILQFCGDRSDGTLWIGLNGNWLYYGIDVYDEGEEIYVLTWFPSDPETATNPVFDDLPASPYVLCYTGDDGAGGSTYEELTLLTHIDDIIYSPPTGFSVVSERRDLPLMTWDQNDPYYEMGDPPPYCLFTNSYKTIEGNEVKARSNHPIVPDRWYFEIKVTNVPEPYLQVLTYVMYGLTTGSVSLNDIYIDSNSWVISFGLATNQPTTTVSIHREVSAGSLRILSTDGVSALTEINDNDVFQFAGDKSNQTLWVGLNGNWLYWGDEVYDEINEVWEIQWSTLGDPETDDNPVFDDLPTTPYVFTKTGENFGPTPERNTLLTHTDDIIYSPPTGFSVVSGEAETTYLHVLQTTNPMPISQPTQHHLMGVLGL